MRWGPTWNSLPQEKKKKKTQNDGETGLGAVGDFEPVGENRLQHQPAAAGPLHRLRHPGDPGPQQGASRRPTHLPARRGAPDRGPVPARPRRGGRGGGSRGRDGINPVLLQPACLPGHGAVRPAGRTPAAAQRRRGARPAVRQLRSAHTLL